MCVCILWFKQYVAGLSNSFKKIRLFFLFVTTLKWLRFLEQGSMFLSLALIGSWWFSEGLLTSSLCLSSWLLFICHYFITEIPNGFPCLHTVIRKAKNTRQAARVFVRFSQVSQDSASLDHSIQTRESIWYFLNDYRAQKIECCVSLSCGVNNGKCVATKRYSTCHSARISSTWLCDY